MTFVGGHRHPYGAVIMHTRTEFQDWPELERWRHLWRFWLGNPDIRPRSLFFENWRDGVQQIEEFNTFLSEYS